MLSGLGLEDPWLPSAPLTLGIIPPVVNIPGTLHILSNALNAYSQPLVTKQTSLRLDLKRGTKQMID